MEQEELNSETKYVMKETYKMENAEKESSKFENAATETCEKSEHGMFSNLEQGAEKNNSEGRNEAINTTRAPNKLDFRQTAKYKDAVTYEAQRHHSIGEGLFITDEIRDLPPRYRTKVIQALKNALVLNNCQPDWNPLEFFTSFHDDSKTDDANRDKLVYLPPDLLEKEKRLNANAKEFKSSQTVAYSSQRNSEPYLANPCPTFSNSPEPQCPRNSSFRSNMNDKSPAHVSKNYKQKSFNSRGKNNGWEKSTPEFLNHNSNLPKSDSFQFVKSSQLTNNQPNSSLNDSSKYESCSFKRDSNSYDNKSRCDSHLFSQDVGKANVRPNEFSKNCDHGSGINNKKSEVISKDLLKFFPGLQSGSETMFPKNPHGNFCSKSSSQTSMNRDVKQEFNREIELTCSRSTLDSDSNVRPKTNKRTFDSKSQNTFDVKKKVSYDNYDGSVKPKIPCTVAKTDSHSGNKYASNSFNNKATGQKDTPYKFHGDSTYKENFKCNSNDNSSSHKKSESKPRTNMPHTDKPRDSSSVISDKPVRSHNSLNDGSFSCDKSGYKGSQKENHLPVKGTNFECRKFRCSSDFTSDKSVRSYNILGGNSLSQNQKENHSLEKNKYDSSKDRYRDDNPFSFKSGHNPFQENYFSEKDNYLPNKDRFRDSSGFNSSKSERSRNSSDGSFSNNKSGRKKFQEENHFSEKDDYLPNRERFRDSQSFSSGKSERSRNSSESSSFSQSKSGYNQFQDSQFPMNYKPGPHKDKYKNSSNVSSDKSARSYSSSEYNNFLNKKTGFKQVPRGNDKSVRSCDPSEVSSICDSYNQYRNIPFGKNYKDSNSECYRQSSNKNYNEKRGREFDPKTKLPQSKTEYSEKNCYSSSYKDNFTNSQRSNHVPRQSTSNKRNNKPNFKMSDNEAESFIEDKTGYRNRGCIENGFFVKVEALDKVEDLSLWIRVFQDMLKSIQFDLERCCHFSNILILEFQRREHASNALNILHKKKTEKLSENAPSFLVASNIKSRLIKPCNCQVQVKKDCAASIKCHFESSLGVIDSKIEEIENSQFRGNKFSSRKQTAESKILKTFEESKAVFIHCKENTLSGIQNAEELRTVQQLKHSFIRECNAFKRCLPIYSKKNEILHLARYFPVSVIVAETGSGKSTQIVDYLLHSDISTNGCIICTQPRKLAAISIAQFVSGQIGSAVGRVVGYDVGIEKKCSDVTKIVYMTDYRLLKEFLKNRELKGVSCIVIDEAHERSLYTDLILGLLKECLVGRKDLSVIVTSATINPSIFVNYFNMPNECIVDVPGRSYPVDIIWLSSDVEIGWDYVEACVDQAYEIHVSNEEGDILVFLTAPAESEDAIYLFKKRLRKRDKKPELLSLHGKSDIQEQMQVFQNIVRGPRKIVFATNVAETAVTIPGIKYVVDSGMTKDLMFDPKYNKSYLTVTFINKSAAEQRMGRAGRTQSGICYRMYSERNYFEDMPDNAVPEIFKTNLQKAVLKMFELGIDPENFDFIETPQERTISNSVESLEYLGAVKDKKLTEFGRKIAKLPLEPQLSKLVLRGLGAEIGFEAIVIASLVSEAGKLFIRSIDNRNLADEKKMSFCHIGGDLCTYLEIYKRWKEVPFHERYNWCVENFISAKGLNSVAKTVREILLIVRGELNTRVSTLYNNKGFKEQYQKIIFDSFSENLCVLSGHPKLGYLSPYLPESFHIHPSSTLSNLGMDSPEFLVYSTLMETSRNFLFDITPISEATINLANQTGSFKLPLHSLKCLEIPPKVIGPFGESVLIRHIIGKQGTKIKDLEEKIRALTGLKSIYVDVAVDKGLITVYLSQKFHEKVSKFVISVVAKAHEEMLREEDLIKFGTSLFFAMTAGGLINDIMMPGDFRELVLNNVKSGNSNGLEKMLENYGTLQSISSSLVKGKKGMNNVCVTYKTVEDAQKAFADLKREEKFKVSAEPYLRHVNSGKTSTPLHILHISWWSTPCTGFGSVEFSSEEDLIVASNSLTYATFYLGNNKVLFTPLDSEYIKALSVKNLPPSADEFSVGEKLKECLPKNITVKKINIYRKRSQITDGMFEETNGKLSKLLHLYTSSTNFDINLKRPDLNEPLWNAYVYFSNDRECERTYMKLKDNTHIDSFPLQVEQTFKLILNCSKKVFDTFSKDVNIVLQSKDVCKDFSVKDQGDWVNIEVICISLEKLTKARIKLKSFLVGESLEFIGKPKYHFLFCDGHREKITDIQRSTNTLLCLAQNRKIITLYGSLDNCEKAKEKIYSILSNPDYSHTRTFKLVDSCIPNGFLKMLYTRYGFRLENLLNQFQLIAALIDESGNTLTLKGTNESITKAEQALEILCENLFQSKGQRLETSTDHEICPICFDPLSYDFQRLEYCGHAFCRQCLLLQVESKTLPLVCAKQNCEKFIILEDIKRIISLSKDNLKKDFCAAALQYHVSCNIGKLSYCHTPDCQMVYRITKEGSQFVCPACSNLICRSCQSPYHYGMSCDMYQCCEKDEDYSLKVWVKENEASRKFCPSCKIVIEKIDGCNHMECLHCKAHLCWLCLEIFPNGDEVYEHLPYCAKNQ